MKRLILMRHAKSDWSAGISSDHDRPLNPRGRRAAAALGDWLRDMDLAPDQVLSSSSVRTRETIVRLDLAPGTDVQFDRSLYLADQMTILHALRAARGETVLMLGHNPGIGVFAETIVSASPAHPRFGQYPTGATLVVDFEIDDWGQADWGTANARHFVVPREL